jgi:hypothetical protein
MWRASLSARYPSERAADRLSRGSVRRLPRVGADGRQRPGALLVRTRVVGARHVHRGRRTVPEVRRGLDRGSAAGTAARPLAITLTKDGQFPGRAGARPTFPSPRNVETLARSSVRSGDFYQSRALLRLVEGQRARAAEISTGLAEA